MYSKSRLNAIGFIKNSEHADISISPKYIDKLICICYHVFNGMNHKTKERAMIFHVINSSRSAMRYFRVFFVIAVSLVLCCGCSGVDGLEFAKEVYIGDGTPLLLENDILLCVKETASNENPDASDNEFFSIDIDSGESRVVGTLYGARTSSGDILLSPDGNVYLTYQTVEKSATLYKLDLENGSITPVYESVSSLPFQFLSVLDDENLVLFEPDNVVLYNLLSEQTDTVARDDADEICSAYAYNGRIYCLMYTDGEYRIDVLKADGTLDETIPLDSEKLREASSANGNQYGILRMYVSYGTAWLKTLADTVVPISLSDGSQQGEALDGYRISHVLSQTDKSGAVLYRTHSSEVSLFSEVNGKLSRCDLPAEKDGKAVSIRYAFFGNNQREIVVMPDDSDSVLLYKIK